MSTVKISHGEWVLVCDGKKALVLENAGDEKFPNLNLTLADFELGFTGDARAGT
jgi:protein required for attachment to host cells